MNDKNSITLEHDDFCNTDYDSEEEYYRSKKTSINEKEVNKYYESHFIDLFEKHVKNE